MPFLPPNQQRQSTEGIRTVTRAAETITRRNSAAVQRFSTDLSLPERERVELRSAEAAVVGELEQGGGGVGARRQDEHERRQRVAVGVRAGQVERRWLHERTAQLLDHKVRHLAGRHTDKTSYDTHTHTRLTALCPGLPG